jgi:quinol monooxygenase YgiN
VPVIYVIATLVVRAEQRDAFVADAPDVIQATRAERGCLRYDLTSSLMDPLTFVFVEQWESRAALDAHFETPHLRRWRELCQGYVAERRVEIIRAEQVDVV